jgi:hypothetical protein
MKVNYIRKCGPKYISGTIKATSGGQITSLKPISTRLWSSLLNTAGGVPHSPIRAVEYRLFIYDVPSWVATHYSRHHIGSQPYIFSQRDDRNNNLIPRAEEKQGKLINMVLDLNVNAILNIAKARLCNKAAKETREVFKQFKDQLAKSTDEYDQILASYMRPPCEWYQKCFEITPCAMEKSNE